MQLPSLYNTTTCNLKIILNFFVDKFNVLTSIFFSNDYILDRLTLEGKYEEMDKIFEEYIDNSNINRDINVNTRANITQDSNQMDIDSVIIENVSENKNIIFLKTRIEILNIINLIFNNLHEVKFITEEMLGFLDKVLELYLMERESKEVRIKILCLSKL